VLRTARKADAKEDDRGWEVGKGKEEKEESRFTGAQLPLRLDNPFGINTSMTACWSSLGDGADNSSEVSIDGRRS
jgi:hypothetical protein